MPEPSAPPQPRPPTTPCAWSRVRFTLLFSLAVGLLLGLGSPRGPWPALARTTALGLCLLLVFGALEQWPRQLPRWLARWVLQVVAVAAAVPLVSALIFALARPAGEPPFYHVRESMGEYSRLSGLALFLAPWTALAALVRQKEALAREQALAFQLERSELERQALAARLGLLQAQVAPHFLFNTLANVQVLVETGSPRAPAVLRSLIAYLRAAVPRLGSPTTTLGREKDLVEAYLELMHMRMPDRLEFAIHIDPEAAGLRCPPMTVLTLVENAVRHGIDPSEDGGRIDVRVERHGARCRISVSDTGGGLGRHDAGLGTGLVSLRERVGLACGGDVRLQVSARQPRGVLAELDFPAQVAEP